MQPPFNVSKIIPPRSPGILRRSRLLGRLEQQRDKKLVLLLGQAAQGKSTLALSYASASKIPSAWLNLGPEDSEAVNLFYLLVHALQRVLPEVDLSPLLAYPSLAAGPREEIPLYRDWLLSLLSQIQVPVQVVFDGLDRLSPQAPAFRFLQVLLEVAPPHFHLLLLSREMPPLNIQELKIRQEAHIIRNEELAFTAKETRDFLHMRKLLLPYDLIVQLYEITEGWIGGLVLLCETLERLPEESRERFLIQEVSEKFAEEVSSYFDESIFSSRSEAVQEFLLKSSILAVVEPDFIKDYLGTDNTREILGELSQKNLFVQPIFDKQRGWLYRYHNLFKDFLQAKFKELLPPEQQASAYYRAGSLFEERGDLESAVDFYLQAGATAQAVAAMERVGHELLEKGKTAELVRWLQSLPPTLVQDHPWLLLYHFLTGRFSGSMDALFSLRRSLSLFQQQQDTRGLLLASAYFLEASIFGGYDPPVKTQVEQAEKLLHGDNSQAFPYESAVLWFYVGWSQLLGYNPRAGFRACRKAALLAREAGKRHLEINALIRCHLILSCLGEFAAAEEICQQVDKLLAHWTSPELQAMQLLISGQLKLFKGELEQAETLVKAAQQQTEKHGLTFLYPVVQLYRFMCLGHLGRYEEALEIGLNLLEHMAVGNDIVTGIVYWHLAVISYHQGDLSAAKRFSEQGRQFFSSSPARSDLHLSLLKVGAAMISYHLEESESAAEQDLQEALQYATGASNYSALADVHWALALWRWRQGRLEEARAHLKTGMKIAAQRGSYFSMILSPQDRGRIFTLALELGVKEVWDSLPPLLVPLADLVGPDLENLLYHPDKRVADQAWEIRRAIHRARALRLTIQTLGGFRLSRGETPLAEDDWEGHQPQVLFKAMLAHGTQGVVKDVLLEDLWPEADPEGAEKNFKVNLHRLRKALEPDLDKTFGSSYIHLKANRVSLDAELCDLDVEKFLALIKAGEKKEAQGRVKEAVTFYKEAVASYGGDFLPEELYFPWAEVKRAELRGTYAELLHRLAGLYEKQGTLTRAIDCYQKAVNADPLDEPACQRLMLLHAQRGRRSAALKVYQDCCLALKKELNTEPDEVTAAIYQKILASP